MTTFALIRPWKSTTCCCSPLILISLDDYHHPWWKILRIRSSLTPEIAFFLGLINDANNLHLKTKQKKRRESRRRRTKRAAKINSSNTLIFIALIYLGHEIRRRQHVNGPKKAAGSTEKNGKFFLNLMNNKDFVFPFSEHFSPFLPCSRLLEQRFLLSEMFSPPTFQWRMQRERRMSFGC